MIREYSASRACRLRNKLKSMNPGDQLRVGVSTPLLIHAAAGAVGVLLASVSKTDEITTRDDGLEVPVYLVTFR
jgi:hypothetical protein